jgi:anti-sigma factor RsiW
MTDQEVLVKLLATQAAQTEKLTQIGEKIDDLHATFHGPQGEPEHGVLVRVDRLEQTEKRRAKLIWLLVGSVVGLLVQAGGTLLGWIKP